MNRERRFRLAFVAMAVVGILGAGAGTWLEMGVEFVAFCVVVGVGALAILVRGESSVAPVTFSVGLFAVVLAVGYGVRDTLTGASFAVLAAVAIARDSQYYRAYNT